MKIAYVCHQSRYNYEQSWFQNLPVDEIKFISGDELSPLPGAPKNIKYIPVPYKAKGWQNRFFAQTAKLVYYSDYQKHLEDVDAVIVLEVFSSLSKQFVKYCRSINKPVFVLVYEVIAKHPIYKLPRYRANTRYTLKNATGLITITDAAASHLIKLGAKADKITTVYPGIDLELFKPSPKKDLSPGIIFIGRLEPHKGIDIVLDVYQKLKPEFKNLRLTIAGKGSWQDRVNGLAAQDKSVKYLNHIPNNELPDHLNQNLVSILPARDSMRLGQKIGAEQFGFSIVESMACGLPVVTSDCGALAEIVTSKNPVCPQNDVEAFYQAVARLLSSQPAAKKLGQDNRRLAEERYDIKKESKKLVDVISKTIKAGEF